MLNELNDLQESEEDIWAASSVSFTIETRSEEGGEIVQREYTFSRAKEWDKWMFQEFEERRTKDTRKVTSRDWRRTKNITWDESDSPTVNVPPEVSGQVEELLELDEITLQVPGAIE